MIDRLDIENYRSLRKVSLHPGPLTCLIGANGSGKTNVLEVLELIRAAAEGALSSFVNERQGFRSLVFFGAPGDEVGIRARLRGGTRTKPLTLRYELQLAASGGSYTVAQELLKPTRKVRGRPEEYIKNIGGEGNLATGDGRDHVPSKREKGPGARETFLGHFRAPRAYPELSSLQDDLRAWTFLSFSRIDTRPGSPARSPRPLGDSGRLDPDGRNLTDVLGFLQSSHEHVFVEVRDACRAAFPEILDLVVKPLSGTHLWVTQARVKGASDPVPAWSLSDGVLRFLSLATALLSPSPSRLLVLDEPEVGMHPAIAPNLAELLRGAGQVHRQVFVATHSADLVDQLTADEVTVVEKDAETGGTHLRPLSDDADLQSWVGEYRLGDLWREGHLGGRP